MKARCKAPGAECGRHRLAEQAAARRRGDEGEAGAGEEAEAERSRDYECAPPAAATASTAVAVNPGVSTAAWLVRRVTYGVVWMVGHDCDEK